MFNKIKGINDIRKQAKVIEKALKNIEVTGSSNGVEITMNGKQEILNVVIPEASRDDIAKGVKKAMEEVTKKLQGEIQKAMKETGGLPDLSALGM